MGLTMGLAMGNKGYRANYEKRTGKIVPRNFTVHHINHNRLDGDIFNLVALPDRLHIRYHQLYPQIVLDHSMLQLPVNTDEVIDVLAAASRLAEFAKLRAECLRYINYRNFLLGMEELKHKRPY